MNVSVRSIRTKNPLYLLLVTALIMGLVGAYVLYQAKAACNPGDPGTVLIGDCPVTQYNRQVGEVVTLPVTAYVPDPRVGQYPSQQIHVTLEFSSKVDQNDNRTSYVSYACGGAGACHNLAPSSGKDFKLCIDVNQSYFGQTNVQLLSATYRSNFYGRWWAGIDYSWVSGTCSSPSGFYSNGGAIGTTLGQCGTPSDLCSGTGGGGGGGGGGSGGSGGTGGESTGGTGGGSGGGGSGTAATTNKQGSGGGGGSSAKKQSDQPNTTPSSSSQGQSKPTVLEPSPFFDGKEYKPGSDADTFASTAAKAGKTVLTKWYLILPVLLLLAAFSWRLYRRGLPHNPFKKNRVV